MTLSEEGKKPWMGLVSGPISCLINLIKGLIEMYKSMTGVEKVNRNLFKIVKAESVL